MVLSFLWSFSGFSLAWIYVPHFGTNICIQVKSGLNER